MRNQYWSILLDKDIAPIFFTAFHFDFSCGTRKIWPDMLVKLDHACNPPSFLTRYFSNFPSTMIPLCYSVSCNHNLGQRTVQILRRATLMTIAEWYYGVGVGDDWLSTSSFRARRHHRISWTPVNQTCTIIHMFSTLHYTHSVRETIAYRQLHNPKG